MTQYNLRGNLPPPRAMRSQMFVGVKEEMRYLPVDKRCLVKRKVVEKETILSHEDIIEYKQICTNEGAPINPTKAFLQMIYNNESYQRHLYKVKRGANAKNWKDSSDQFICPSLHLVNNIYDALGKKKWSHHGNHGKQHVDPSVVRCQVILKSGKQCSRKECNTNTHYCTLHHKKFILSR